MMPPLTQHERTTLQASFWSAVDKSGECWTWMRAASSTGYGAVTINQRQRAAHRVAWELTSGPIAEGLQVLHRCDNPACVRPEHLFLGTQADNMRDMVSKGRHVNPRLTLSDADVVAIKAARIDPRHRAEVTRSRLALAKRYGVAVATIKAIQIERSRVA